MAEHGSEDPERPNARGEHKPSLPPWVWLLLGLLVVGFFALALAVMPLWQ